ncbi:hypothetical protein QR680_006720 [Steinernema hermaphroditum]|uniref:DDT domain-containing protein n=1 Tax=Steinernema hermaphroditum TaxID=289476 RepID=A0AA39LXV2_9BILA|nr:hypothetical protein QR680_006720 [Steinernema hermaphroditum]
MMIIQVLLFNCLLHYLSGLPTPHMGGSAIVEKQYNEGLLTLGGEAGDVSELEDPIEVISKELRSSVKQLSDEPHPLDVPTRSEFVDVTELPLPLSAPMLGFFDLLLRMNLLTSCKEALLVDFLLFSLGTVFGCERDEFSEIFSEISDISGMAETFWRMEPIDLRLAKAF